MEGERSDLPEAGWYDDPDGRPGRKRYWSGDHWTTRYKSAKAPTEVDEIDRSFRTLFLLARVLHVLGWVTIVVGTIAVIAAAVEAGSSEEVIRDAFGQTRTTDPGASAAVIAVFGGLGVALYALILFGAAALIRLALRVEDNTFRTAAAAEELASRPAA